MPNKQKVIEIGDMTYFKLAHLGDCDNCGEDGDSYNENGELLCEECLIKWHNKNDKCGEGD